MDQPESYSQMNGGWHLFLLQAVLVCLESSPSSTSGW